ncbi:MORN repeat-containing protein 3, partial [Acanthisitta chloris]
KEYRKVYAGWWENDQRSGHGVCFHPGGERYEGEWSHGVRSRRDGSVYEGEWLADRPNGQGLLLLSNENLYEGGWKDGKKHGPGRFFYLDKGQLLEGIWAADIPKCGILMDFNRDEAPAPTQYPIPKLELADPEGVLAEAWALLDDSHN